MGNAEHSRVSLRTHPATRGAFALLDSDEVQIWNPFRREWITRSSGSDVYACVYIRYTVFVRGVNVVHCPGLDELLAGDTVLDGNPTPRFREAYLMRYGHRVDTPPEHVPVGGLPTPESSDEEDGVGQGTVWF